MRTIIIIAVENVNIIVDWLAEDASKRMRENLKKFSSWKKF